MKEITLPELLEAGCHFGHQTVRWNPKMKPYIYGAKDGVHIFDLAKTKEGLERACEFVKEVVSKWSPPASASGAAGGGQGKILFLGTKRQAREVVEKVAKKVGMPYVSTRWLGGTLTNFEQIQKSLKKLQAMKEKREAGEYKEFTKKEQLLLDREIAKLERFFGGLAGLEDLPAALFIVDVRKEWSAAKEAQRRNVKVIAMTDTNANPDLVDYIIPANDDAAKAVELIVGAIGEAVEEGKRQEHKENQENQENQVRKAEKKRGRPKKTAEE